MQSTIINHTKRIAFINSISTVLDGYEIVHWEHPQYIQVSHINLSIRLQGAAPMHCRDWLIITICTLLLTRHMCMHTHTHIFLFHAYNYKKNNTYKHSSINIFEQKNVTTYNTVLYIIFPVTCTPPHAHTNMTCKPLHHSSIHISIYTLRLISGSSKCETVNTGTE